MVKGNDNSTAESQIVIANALLNRGVNWNDNSGVVGLHGTSIENFVSMLKKGTIEMDAQKSKAQGSDYNGRFYVIPYKSAFQNHPLHSQLTDMTPNTVFQAAADYSNIAAFYSYMNHFLPGVVDNRDYATLLPLDLRNGKHTRGIVEKLIDKAKTKGFDRNFARKKIAEGIYQRRGIVLSIGPNILDFEVKNGEETPGREVYVEEPKIPTDKVILGAQVMIPDFKDEIYQRLRDSNFQPDYSDCNSELLLK
jgi:hypothetical protein